MVALLVESELDGEVGVSVEEEGVGTEMRVKRCLSLLRTMSWISVRVTWRLWSLGQESWVVG